MNMESMHIMNREDKTAPLHRSLPESQMGKWCKGKETWVRELAHHKGGGLARSWDPAELPGGTEKI